MKSGKSDGKFAEVTEVIIGAFYDVYNALGYGFLEQVYENALAIELRKRGLGVVQQEAIKVFYQGYVVGEYYADLVVDGCVLLELKASKAIVDRYEAQLLNYLKATEYEVGLVLNFGPRPGVRRRVYDNHLKTHLNLS